ncbi:MAG: aldo/keto reductase [Aureispira sp.]
MVDIDCLSSVGVGTYRMSIDYDIHFQALKTAVENGYNLIDTATNYCNGTSEELIGKFIDVYPSYADKLFIISKVGYLPSIKSRTTNFLQFLEEKKPAIAEIDTDFEYSSDLNFIAYQLEQSLKKVGRDYLDVYLLHNPERLLQSKKLNQSSDLHAAISKAFTFLEQQVKEGKIRYYGVSSNTIIDPHQTGSINCQELLDIATSIQTNHHFKFIQATFDEDSTTIEPLFQATKQQTYLHALNNQTNKTQLFLEQLKQENIPIKENTVLTACNAYLHHFKLDHVLVGLRTPTYVHALNQTFTS